MREIPTKEGLWFRRYSGHLDYVVRVHQNVNDAGRKFPLAWYMEGFGYDGWVGVEDDGHWVREVRVDDVSAEEAAIFRTRAETAEAEVARLQDARVYLNSVVSRIDYVRGEPNEMECSPYDVHANPDAVVQGVVELRARAEKAEATLAAAKGAEAALAAARAEGATEERAAVVAWLRRNPGVPRAPECITAMTPFECADAIKTGRHARLVGK